MTHQRTTPTHWLAWTLLVLLALAAGIPAAVAADRLPLLMEGKSTLFQRILTRPETPLTAAPGQGAASEVFPPFEMFYVYDRTSVDGTPFLEVGRSLEGGPEGWMPAAKTIEWKHAVVLGFNNPANRERALIFRSREALEESLAGEDVMARLAQLREDAMSGNITADSPVVSIEPEEHVDIAEEFYVLPILDAYNIRLPTNMPTKLLKVASVPEGAASEPPSREASLANFRIGVVFVIDTTKSMQPYIDAVTEAVGRLRERIAGNPEAERFRFGLVAFRDNLELAPDLEYLTRTYLELGEDATADRFLEAIGEVGAADANSSGFNEDAIAGLMSTADMNWEPFGGRYVILISDAGPRPPGAEAARGSLAPREASEILNERGIALFAVHLETPQGSFDHPYAAEAYQALANFDGNRLYFPIEGGRPQAFTAQIDVLASQLEGMVSAAIEGRVADAAAGASDIERAATRVGRAMQLAYLGRAAGTAAPDVFEGWLTQNDPLDRRARPVKPYVLMSRNDLSTLRDVLERTIDLSRDATQGNSSSEFFDRLREAVALITRNPEAVADAGTLGGLLGEYLEDLPYNSEITNLTEEDWRLLSPIQERQLIDTLRSKVVALSQIHDEPERWHPISPDAPDGEYITTVPLSLMP